MEILDNKPLFFIIYGHSETESRSAKRHVWELRRIVF